MNNIASLSILYKIIKCQFTLKKWVGGGRNPPPPPTHSLTQRERERENGKNPHKNNNKKQKTSKPPRYDCRKSVPQVLQYVDRHPHCLGFVSTQGCGELQWPGRAVSDAVWVVNEGRERGVRAGGGVGGGGGGRNSRDSIKTMTVSGSPLILSYSITSLRRWLAR